MSGDKVSFTFTVCKLTLDWDYIKLLRVDLQGNIFKHFDVHGFPGQQFSNIWSFVATGTELKTSKSTVIS